jgi:hypothetical protein
MEKIISLLIKIIKPSVDESTADAEISEADIVACMDEKEELFNLKAI